MSGNRKKYEGPDTDIAVVGMGGRFPGARRLSDYWENIRNGVESVTAFSDEQLKEAGVAASVLRDPDYVKAGVLLEGYDLWDAGFFGFNPKDAAIMDPQHRVFLECSWEALEDAGYPPEKFDGNIGVYAGCGMNSYMMFNILSRPDLIREVGLFLLRHTGNDKDFLATRVSYELNLHGPSVNVQTACSTSLVAVHLGCQSLLNGECDLILAGGVTIDLPQGTGHVFQEGEVLSRDGHCRAFAAGSSGTVFGSGAGVVVLKRMAEAVEDGDYIHGVIRGSAVNNDGSEKVGYLAPSVDGQAKAIMEALSIADVSPDSISYIETHGTGTALGDPIEVAALTQAFRSGTELNQFCGIGSVKTNIGHLDTAAGVAGMIKALEALKHRELPPSLNFDAPNPDIDFESTPFYVNAELKPWESQGVRRAGISSLGVGGTNAHIILEEAPPREPSGQSRDWHLLPISARSEKAVNRASENLLDHLQDHPELELADLAYTLQVGRRGFAHRRALVCRDRDEAIAILDKTDAPGGVSGQAPENPPAVVFVFPGGGAQYPGAAQGLYSEEPVFKDALDECFNLLAGKVDFDLRSLMFPDPDARETAAAELARPLQSILSVFLISHALVRLWEDWGVRPAAMTGHSLGEYVAACTAGVMRLEDALDVVILRGRIFERLPEGTMLSVPLTEDELGRYLDDDLSIAAVNAPGMSVASGSLPAIAGLESRLEQDGVEYQRVNIDVAAHSPMLEPFLEEFRNLLATIELKQPELPFISNLSGKWVEPEEVTAPDYWVRHLRHTVRFADGVAEILKDSSRIFLEVGPGKALSSLIRHHPERKSEQVVLSSMRHPDEQAPDMEFLAAALGQLWCAGLEIDWQQFHSREIRNRVPLPTYPFERQRFFIEPGEGGAGAVESALEKKEDTGDWFYQSVWSPTTRPRDVESSAPTLLVASPGPWLDGISQAMEACGIRFKVAVPGTGFEDTGARYSFDPTRTGDWESLLAAMPADPEQPLRIVHALNLNAGGKVDWDSARTLAFDGLLALGQALDGADLTGAEIIVLSHCMQQVAGEKVADPLQALALGPCRVIPRENPDVSCRSVDLDIADPCSASALPVLKAVLAERPSEEEPVVAYRGGRRFAQTFAPSPLPAAETAEPILFRDGGVYLVTGGLGGIMLALQDGMITEGKPRIALVTRTPFPPRENWDRLSRGRSRTARKIRGARRLEERGAELLILTGDVGSPSEMGRMVDDVRNRFGEIDGVIHAAGVLDDGLISMKDRESVDNVLLPKARGAVILDELFAGRDLDFFVLFSSVSALAGAAGQVDYVAANACLDAIAASRSARDGSPACSIGWCAWQETGMAADFAAAAGVQAGTNGDTEAVSAEIIHPMLQRQEWESSRETVFSTDYSVGEHWVLNEHRLKSGEALIPGSGFMELARAACDIRMPGVPVELSNVFLMAPFVVGDDETRELRIRIASDDDGEFSVLSRIHRDGGPEDAWMEHVSGTAKFIHTERQESDGVDLDSIRGRCNLADEQFEEQRPEAHLKFGPRWGCLKRLQYGEGEALATLELDTDFAADLDQYHLHPAILDMATASAQSLIPGYDAGRDFFVPVTYGSLKAWGKIAGKTFSHIRYLPAKDGNGEFAEFDVTICDENGAVCLDISQFTMKRVDGGAQIATAPEGAAGPAVELENPAATLSPAAADSLRATLERGLTTEEGLDSFRRIISSGAGPHLVVSPQDLDALLAELRGGPDAASGKRQAVEEPEVDTGRVESALREHEAVAEVVVAAKHDRPGETRLIAYVVYDHDQRATVSELRRHARKNLPDELVPANFLELDEFPLTADGGINRVALPDPFVPEDDYVAPRTDTEKMLAAIWQDVLGVKAVGVYDNFFDIGGHSLLSMRVVNKLLKKTGVKLNQAIMVLQTLEQIAGECERQLGIDSSEPESSPDPAPETPEVAAAAGGSIGKRLFGKVRSKVFKG